MHLEISILNSIVKCQINCQTTNHHFVQNFKKNSDKLKLKGTIKVICGKLGPE